MFLTDHVSSPLGALGNLPHSTPMVTGQLGSAPLPPYFAQSMTTNSQSSASQCGSLPPTSGEKTVYDKSLLYETSLTLEKGESRPRWDATPTKNLQDREMLHSPADKGALRSPAARSLAHSPADQSLLYSSGNRGHVNVLAEESPLHSPVDGGTLHSPADRGYTYSPVDKSHTYSPADRSLADSPVAKETVHSHLERGPVHRPSGRGALPLTHQLHISSQEEHNLPKSPVAASPPVDLTLDDV